MKADHYRFRGHIFGAFIYIIGGYSMMVFQKTDNSVLWVLHTLGMFLFLFCLDTLYFRHNSLKKLLTNGVFKYTRHPMYTGVALVYLVLLNPANFKLPLFWVLTFLHYGFMIVAAYFQEKEVLARFEQEAVEYYKRTPRLFFLYPWYVERTKQKPA